MVYIQQLNIKNNNILNIIDNKNKLNRLLIKNKNKYVYLNLINYININLTKDYIYVSLNKNIIISKSFFLLITNSIKKIILNNIFKYTIKLSITGIGYFFKIKTKNIISIKVEKTHIIDIKLPNNINFNIENNGTILHLDSYNKQLLTLVASRIKLLSKFNIYKGKGIYYSNENIKLKITKKVKNS